MADHPSASRKIIHVDMDAFFASVEQRDDPRLRGRPVAVGHVGSRGVVAAASYEARAFGVRSAMAMAQALRRCPALQVVPPRFEAYRAVSGQVRGIFSDYADVIEPLSLDEAYLDVTADKAAIGTATATTQAIRARIRAETGLTASAGVSYNKFLAKLASDHNKPDGLCVVTPSRGEAFAAALPVARFHGVGPVTAARLARLGIHTGADLASWARADLVAELGGLGGYLHLAARGIDDRPVRDDRPRKSIGSETTFANDIADRGKLAAALEPALAAIERHAAAKQLAGRTLVLKARYADFRTITRSRTGTRALAAADALRPMALDLLDRLFPLAQPIRLIGLTLSGLVPVAELEPLPLLL